MATVKRKVIANLTVSGVTLGIVDAPYAVGAEVESDKAAAFGDSVYTQLARRLASLDDLVVQCIYEGTMPTLKVGSYDSFTITPVFTDGSTSAAAAFTETCSVGSVKPGGTVSVDGERKATIVITLRPVGGADRSNVEAVETVSSGGGGTGGSGTGN